MIPSEVESLCLHYLPGSKFDTVEELPDGGIVVHPYAKRFFNYLTRYQGCVYHYNSLTGLIGAFDYPGTSYRIVNASQAARMKGRTGFVSAGDDFLFYHPEKRCIESFDSRLVINNTFSFPEPVDAIGFDDGKLYIYNRTAGEISCYSFLGEPGKRLANYPVKGIGNKSMQFIHGDVWLTDSEENLILVYSLPDFRLKYQLITPFIDPQAMVLSEGKKWVLYGGEVNESSYSQRCWAEQKPFLHELKTRIEEKGEYTLAFSNSFRVDYTYEEHYRAPAGSTGDFSLSMALPLTTSRQKLLGYDVLGMAGAVEEQDRLVFPFADVSADSAGFAGYRARLALSSLKYTFHCDFIETMIPPGYVFPDRPVLMTGHPVMRAMAEILPRGLLADVLELRNRVFRKLSYKANPDARDYVEVLSDGYGTCGDYTSIILALAIIRGFPVRTVGGFKIPRFVNSAMDNRSCYYNHTWLDVYVPGAGWVPFESSSDDREFQNRLCEGQFLGEDWSHIRTHYDKSVPGLLEIKGCAGDLHPYDLFSNSTYMKIVGEYAEE